MTAGKNSFPKAERLKYNTEFQQLLRTASSVRENGINLYFLEKPFLEKSRLGIVVSRRVFKRAVDRNRAKRKAREFFRLQKVNFQGNFELFVKIIDGHKLFYNNNLEKVLRHLFKRAGVFGQKQGNKNSRSENNE